MLRKLLLAGFFIAGVALLLALLPWREKGVEAWAYRRLTRLLDIQSIGRHQEGRWNLFHTYPTSPMDIVLLGDSLTEFGNWDEILINARVKNRGVSGLTIGQLVRNSGSFDKLPGDQIFLMIGINDLWQGAGTAELRRDYLELFTELKKHWKPERIYIQSLLPVSDRQFVHRKDAILEINSFLRETAAKEGFRYVDVYSHFADSNNELAAAYSLDGVHLTGEGYRQWGSVLKAYVLPREK